jgi:hypothetical protein
MRLNVLKVAALVLGLASAVSAYAIPSLPPPHASAIPSLPPPHATHAIPSLPPPR